MTVKFVQGTLLTIFLISLVGCVGLVAWSFLNGEISGDSLENLILKLFAAYSIYLSIVLVGIFSQTNGKAAKPAPPLPTYSAILLVVAWNLAIVGRVLAFSLISTTDTVESLDAFLQKVIPASAFIVSGGLTYFFIKLK